MYGLIYEFIPPILLYSYSVNTPTSIKSLSEQDVSLQLKLFVLNK